MDETGEQNETGTCVLIVRTGAFRTESQRAGLGLLKKAKVIHSLCLLRGIKNLAGEWRVDREHLERIQY